MGGWRKRLAGKVINPLVDVVNKALGARCMIIHVKRVLGMLSQEKGRCKKILRGGSCHGFEFIAKRWDNDESGTVLGVEHCCEAHDHVRPDFNIGLEVANRLSVSPCERAVKMIVNTICLRSDHNRLILKST